MLHIAIPILLIYLVGGIGVAINFMYVWGWGDAGYGGAHHEGQPNDHWHKRRRRAFYAVVAWALFFNPIGWVILALFGRKIFRRGVWDVDNGKTHRRWYG